MPAVRVVRPFVAGHARSRGDLIDFTKVVRRSNFAYPPAASILYRTRSALSTSTVPSNCSSLLSALALHRTARTMLSCSSRTRTGSISPRVRARVGPTVETIPVAPG